MPVRTGGNRPDAGYMATSVGDREHIGRESKARGR